jgi:serine/threonine protein kinase
MGDMWLWNVWWIFQKGLLKFKMKLRPSLASVTKTLWNWKGIVCKMKNLFLCMTMLKTKISMKLYSSIKVQHGLNLDHIKWGDMTWCFQLFACQVNWISHSPKGVPNFLNEVKVIKGMNHKNIVKLKGYYVWNAKWWFLVCEYVGNKDLHEVLWPENRIWFKPRSYKTMKWHIVSN